MFGPKTVDSVLRVFVKALADLEEVEHEMVDISNRHHMQADKHTETANEATSEANRARGVINKLSAILS